MIERRNVLEIMNGIPANCFAGSQTRIDLLYTMSDITHVTVHPDNACEVMFRGRYERGNLVDLRSTIWWSQTGSNRRPHACKARALPAELWPRTRRRMLLPVMRRMRSIKVVGLGRLELPTSRLSSARSNQLSYKPLTREAAMARNRLTPDASHKR